MRRQSGTSQIVQGNLELRKFPDSAGQMHNPTCQCPDLFPYTAGYHQQCHEPNIAEQAATDQNFPWTCVYCEQDKENPHLKLDAEDQAATNEDVQHSQEVHNDNEVGKDEDGCDDEMESKLQKDVAKVEASNGKRGDKVRDWWIEMD